MLAGAWFQLDRGVEFLVRNVGLSLPEAWRLCSEVPARLSGLTLPTFDPGQEASFVLARMDDEGLLLEQCVHHGEPYLDRPIRPVETVVEAVCGAGEGMRGD